MKLRWVDCFSETMSLQDAVRDEASADESKIVAYLESGVVFIACPGIERDVLNPQHPIIGSGHRLTDGTWFWPDTLSHYVATYHVRLPEEFVEHLRAMAWTVPASIDVRSLSIDRG